jgi:hypothetical protein
MMGHVPALLITAMGAKQTNPALNEGSIMSLVSRSLDKGHLQPLIDVFQFNLLQNVNFEVCNSLSRGTLWFIHQGGEESNKNTVPITACLSHCACQVMEFGKRARPSPIPSLRIAIRKTPQLS